MVDDDSRRKVLALRADSAELTIRGGARRRGARERADAHSHLFTTLGPLPAPAETDLFGSAAQRALYVFYEEGHICVGVVLDPPVSVHAPSSAALEERVRAHVAEHRGVVRADVHPFGKRVERDQAIGILRTLLADA
ncbi:hypothetical protein ACXET9_15995 [Brachybacterium sp. DNPG3]